MSSTIPRSALNTIGSGAVFSADRRYRWQLTRIRSLERFIRVWILLNPSTADETKDDPTVFRCIQRDIGDGFDGTVVLNIFAWRSTDPMELYKVADPIGYANNEYIRAVSKHPRVGQVVCGWGNHGYHMDRGSKVLTMLRAEGVLPHVLKVTKLKQPWHPLYLPYSLQPMVLPCTTT